MFVFRACQTRTRAYIHMRRSWKHIYKTIAEWILSQRFLNRFLKKYCILQVLWVVALSFWISFIRFAMDMGNLKMESPLLETTQRLSSLRWVSMFADRFSLAGRKFYWIKLEFYFTFIRVFAGYFRMLWTCAWSLFTCAIT